MKKMHPLITLLAALSLLLLYAPLLAMALFSVNNAWRGYMWKGFTLKWYAHIFRDPLIMEAARNTLVLAAVSTVIATIVGTALGVGMDRFPWPRKLANAMDVVMHLPIVSPDIILAAALVVAFGVLRPLTTLFEPGLFVMVLGHVTFQIAFVALVVRGRLATLGAGFDEAARDLYASDLYLWRRVRLPLLMPGIVAGAMLAFTLSLDDFVVSFFTASPDSNTLPLYIYGELRKGITAGTHALSTLILLVTVLLVLCLERISRYQTE